MANDLQAAIDDALRSSPSVAPVVYGPAHAAPLGEKKSRPEIERRLPGRSVKEGLRLHTGIAGFFNFDIAGQTRPDYMLLLDFNRSQEIFWKAIVRILKEAETPAQFRQKFDAACQLPDTQALYFEMTGSDDGSGQNKLLQVNNSHAPKLGEYLDQEASWLRDENAYAHLRWLAQQGRIAATHIDLYEDEARAQALGEVLRAQGLVADTSYWSNVGQWTEPKREGKFLPAQELFSARLDTRGLDYNNQGFSAKLKGPRHWNGEEGVRGKLLAFDELPPFERLLRNVSAIADGGTHMFTDAADVHPALLTDNGPPRNMAHIAARRAKLQAAHR